VELALPRREFEKLLSETRSVFIVDYEDVEQRAVVREIQYHPVKGNMLHVDLIRVKAGQELTVSVPLKFTGNAEGVKMGGIFQSVRSELDITCLPKYLPNELEIDISHLEIGDSIHIRDLNFEHITINAEPERTVCSIVIPKKVEELLPETEEEEGEEEEAAEPEVIGAKDKKEGEEEETEEERSEG
jgi:large subunit ribosomal protein L25